MAAAARCCRPARGCPVPGRGSRQPRRNGGAASPPLLWVSPGVPGAPHQKPLLRRRGQRPGGGEGASGLALAGLGPESSAPGLETGVWVGAPLLLGSRDCFEGTSSDRGRPARFLGVNRRMTQRCGLW